MRLSNLLISLEDYTAIYLPCGQLTLHTALLSVFLPFSRCSPPSSYTGPINKLGMCEEEEGEGN